MTTATIKVRLSAHLCPRVGLRAHFRARGLVCLRLIGRDRRFGFDDDERAIDNVDATTRRLVMRAC